MSAFLSPAGVELTATDPENDDLTVTIDWGDGTVDTQFSRTTPRRFPTRTRALR